MPHQEVPEVTHQIRIREEVIGHVRVHAGARKDADRSVEGFGHEARIFGPFPAHFEKVPVLGIHQVASLADSPKKRASNSSRSGYPL
jgi:hypothetical protein